MASCFFLLVGGLLGSAVAADRIRAFITDFLPPGAVLQWDLPVVNMGVENSWDKNARRIPNSFSKN